MDENFKIVFSPGALLGMREARLWYNLQQKGLGKRFTDDVKKVIASIKLNPYFASVKFENIRTAACKTFPSAVHYEIDAIFLHNGDNVRGNLKLFLVTGRCFSYRLYLRRSVQE